MSPRDPFGWVGTKINQKVEVRAVIGEGGFGVVYRGQHLGFELPVAVKCLRLPPGVDADTRERLVLRFRNEGRLLHQLSRRNANIVQALDVGVATSPGGLFTPYIVMEWLEGETLADEIAGRVSRGAGRRGLHEAARLLAPAAEALASAHEQEVVHRDIKPGNLFLCREDEARVKVLDFGIAKVMAEVAEGAALAATTTWSRAFTPRYAAPEQLSRDLGRIGPWTDVFAFALVLLEAATGEAVARGALLGCSGRRSARRSAWRRWRLRSTGLRGCRRCCGGRCRRGRWIGSRTGALWGALQAELFLRGRQGALGRRQAGAGGRGGLGENRVCTVLAIDLAPLAVVTGGMDPEDAREILDDAARVVARHIDAAGGTRSGRGRRAGWRRSSGCRWRGRMTRSGRCARRWGCGRCCTGLRCCGRRGRAGRGGGAGSARDRDGAHARPARRGRGAVHGGRRGAADGAADDAGGAGGGAFVVSRETFRLVERRFHATELPVADGAREGEPMPSYVVTGPLAVAHGGWQADFHGIETRLQGRMAEKAALAEAIDTMRAEGRASAITLVGAPGMGRTRLLDHVVAEVLARGEPYLVLSAQASALDADTSYGFAATLLRGRFGIEEEDGAEVALHKLRRGLRWLRRRTFRAGGGGAVSAGLGAGELDDALAQLARLVGEAPASMGGTGAGGADDMGPSLKLRFAAAAAQLLRVAASQMPVVLVCDDLHRADGASLDLLEELLLRVEDAPWLAVCSARPQLFERRPRWAEGSASHVRLDIPRLPQRNIEEIVRDHLRCVPDLSGAAVRALAERAEGNPLILVETLHLLVDAGIIEPHEDAPWRLHEERIERVALSATVQGVVLSRLDRLGPQGRRVAAQAAVLGRTFWRGALARVAAADAEHEGGGLEQALALLEERRIVRPRSPSSIPGEREYAFLESATRDVAYELLGGRLRRAMHGAAAKWMEDRAFGSVAPASIALHWELSGAAVRAAELYADAAARAAALGENAEAARHLERAIELSRDHGSGVSTETSG
ncbi:MAG: AAA family ATPase [Polyangiaceae bacterium]